MRYLFEKWDRLKKELGGKYIFLFLDYDGTLVPIAKRPDKAILPQKIKTRLNELSKTPYCRLAIISGRSLKNIKKIVGLKDVIYVGNHGLEIEGPNIKFKNRVSLRFKTIIGHIKKDLIKSFLKTKGVFVEDKDLTLSIHYRLADKNDIPLVMDTVKDILQPYLARHIIRTNSGKKVLEIRPAMEWDKGKVVLWLLARQQFILGDRDILPIYMGDDVTDEDAFKALKNKGLSIFIGKPKDTYAEYYLKNTKETAEFLKKVSDLQKISPYART